MQYFEVLSSLFPTCMGQGLETEPGGRAGIRVKLQVLVPHRVSDELCTLHVPFPTSGMAFPTYYSLALRSSVLQKYLGQVCLCQPWCSDPAQVNQKLAVMKRLTHPAPSECPCVQRYQDLLCFCFWLVHLDKVLLQACLKLKAILLPLSPECRGYGRVTMPELILRLSSLYMQCSVIRESSVRETFFFFFLKKSKPSLKGNELTVFKKQQQCESRFCFVLKKRREGPETLLQSSTQGPWDYNSLSEPGSPS